MRVVLKCEIPLGEIPLGEITLGEITEVQLSKVYVVNRRVRLAQISAMASKTVLTYF